MIGRRSFLALTAATIAGAIPVLRHRVASPMMVMASEPSTAARTAVPPLNYGEPVDERLLARAQRQVAAASERTHTPCYQRCMEQRVEREIAIHHQLEDAFETDRKNAVDKFRGEMARSTVTFQHCIGGCG